MGYALPEFVPIDRQMRPKGARLQPCPAARGEAAPGGRRHKLF